MSRKKEKKKTSINGIEKKIHDLLINMNLPFQTNVQIDRYNVDFLVAQQYIIECYGDYWHCNPDKYTPTYFNRGKKKTAAEIWQRDAERKKRFEELGYIFLNLWEEDIRNNAKNVNRLIKKHITRRMKHARDDA